jgi:hypothetical protein
LKQFLLNFSNLLPASFRELFFTFLFFHQLIQQNPKFATIISIATFYLLTILLQILNLPIGTPQNLSFHELKKRQANTTLPVNFLAYLFRIIKEQGGIAFLALKEPPISTKNIAAEP